MNGWGFDLTMHWLGQFLVLSVVPIALFLRFPSNEESSAHNAADTGQLSAQLAASLAAALHSPFIFYWQ